EAFNVVAAQGWVKALAEGLVEIVNTYQADDVGKILITPGGEFEGDEGHQIHHRNPLDDLTDLRRIWIGNGSRLATPGKQACDKDVESLPIGPIHEPSAPPRDGLILAGNEKALEFLEPSRREEDI